MHASRRDRNCRNILVIHVAQPIRICAQSSYAHESKLALALALALAAHFISQEKVRS
ncbi:MULTISPECIES: hypothetical protein [Burkholderia]|jgi:hypothetical protein|uniref:hypothetical protein n=1 Tax=Burkholderia TaxID=32008 RepID=UPI00167B9FB3|nr:hypothetical protein [Burkholderia contaminans]UTP22250.1 hypothetical protein NMB33_18390 [Burkholderia sp. FXe9]